MVGVCAVQYRGDVGVGRARVRARGVRVRAHGRRAALHARRRALGGVPRVRERRARRAAGQSDGCSLARSLARLQPHRHGYTPTITGTVIQNERLVLLFSIERHVLFHSAAQFCSLQFGLESSLFRVVRTRARQSNLLVDLPCRVAALPWRGVVSRSAEAARRTDKAGRKPLPTPARRSTAG